MRNVCAAGRVRDQPRGLPRPVPPVISDLGIRNSDFGFGSDRRAGARGAESRRDDGMLGAGTERQISVTGIEKVRAIGIWRARLEFSRGFSNRAGVASSCMIGRKVRAIGRFSRKTWT